MAHITRLKDGRYKVRWRNPAPRGQRRKERSRIAPNRKTAEQLLRQIEEATARGEAWEPEDILQAQGLRELADDWLEELSIGKAFSTCKTYAEKLQAFFDFLEQAGYSDPQPDQLDRKTLPQFHTYLGLSF